MYHRVLSRDEAERKFVEPGMYVSPETFGRHISLLNDLFTVLPLWEIVSRIRDAKPLPPGACAITFDDGWRDNLENALPVLRAHEVPATVFAVTDRVGTTGSFWPDEVSRRLSGLDRSDRLDVAAELGLNHSDGSIHAILTYMKLISEAERPRLIDRIRRHSVDPMEGVRELLDWDELSHLAQHGFDVEAHGVSHAILTESTEEEARNELSGALRTLRDRGLGQHGLFAYPSGGVNQEVAGFAGDAGYRGAVTTQTGLARSSGDPLMLPRIGLHEDISSTDLEFLRWVPGSDSFEGR
jgi:peptidoglycan/xylan/chitin deacetylase (PgdA/CDA1 family)